MKLAIIGGRDFTNFVKADQSLQDHFKDHDGEIFYIALDEIVSGGARGSDAIGKRLAEKYGIKYTEFPADWDKYGKSAGFKRNQQIIDACDMVLAFWDGQSKGTLHMINIAKEKELKVFIYELH